MYATDFQTGLFDVFKDSVFHQFRFEPGKETRGLGIIVAIAFARYTLAKPEVV